MKRRQQAPARVIISAAGAGGVAVGVHTTQFEIRLPQFGLLKPVLELASQTIDEELARHPRPFVKVAGVVGETEQAVREAELAKSLGYDAVLLSLRENADGFRDRAIARALPNPLAEIIPRGRLLPSTGGRRAPALPQVLAEFRGDSQCRRHQDGAVQPVSDDRCGARRCRVGPGRYRACIQGMTTISSTISSRRFNSRDAPSAWSADCSGIGRSGPRRAVELLDEIHRVAPIAGDTSRLIAMAGTEHRRHGRQCGVLRRRQRISRLHRRHSRGSTPPGFACREPLSARIRRKNYRRDRLKKSIAFTKLIQSRTTMRSSSKTGMSGCDDHGAFSTFIPFGINTLPHTRAGSCRPPLGLHFGVSTA